MIEGVRHIQELLQRQGYIADRGLATILYLSTRVRKPVLVEGPSKHDPAMLSGRTDDNYVVNFVADPATPLGSMLGVRIDQAQHHTLRGEAT